MPDAPTPTLEELLVEHHDELLRRLRRRGAGLLRYESEEDLAQGVHLRALRSAEGFAYRGEAAFQGWLAQLVRAHVADRHEYWTAARRNGGALVRITQLGSATTMGVGIEPSSPRSGPATFAQRRDLLALAAQAVDVLLPRDQRIVAMIHDGRTTEEVAEALGLTVETAQRTKTRAIERFRRAFELLVAD
jgi:RNA polymerase sigma factor (sigma-70 family)